MKNKPNEHDERKERIRLGLGYVQHHGRTLKDVAAETGIPYGSISAFNSTGVLGKQPTAKIEKWLIDNGVPMVDPYAVIDSPRTIVAEELEVLRKMLLNPQYSDEFAAQKVAAWVRVSYEGLENLIAAIKQSDTDDE